MKRHEKTARAFIRKFKNGTDIYDLDVNDNWSVVTNYNKCWVMIEMEVLIEMMRKNKCCSFNIRGNQLTIVQ